MLGTRDRRPAVARESKARQEYSAAELGAAVQRVTKATVESSKAGEKLKLDSLPVILQIAGCCRFRVMFRNLPKSPGSHSHVAT